MAMCSRPVSYTHLDVYKRQVEITVIVKSVLGVRDTRMVTRTGTVPTLPETVKVVYSDGTEPVSYTHLDVYKRQPIPSSSMRSAQRWNSGTANLGSTSAGSVGLQRCFCAIWR